MADEYRDEKTAIMHVTYRTEDKRANMNETYFAINHAEDE